MKQETNISLVAIIGVLVTLSILACLIVLVTPFLVSWIVTLLMTTVKSLLLML